MAQTQHDIGRVSHGQEVGPNRPPFNSQISPEARDRIVALYDRVLGIEGRKAEQLLTRRTARSR